MAGPLVASRAHAWPGNPSVCERQIGAITCSSLLTTVKRLLDGYLLLSPPPSLSQLARKTYCYQDFFSLFPFWMFL